MNLADTMDQIAARLLTVSAFKKVWPHPPSTVTPPAAIVAYPDEIDPHVTYSRGAARWTIPVVVLVGMVSERSARELLSRFVSDDPTTSLVTLLEATGYTAFDSLTVSGISFDTYTVGAIDYLAAVFDCDIFGSGA